MLRLVSLLMLTCPDFCSKGVDYGDEDNWRLLLPGDFRGFSCAVAAELVDLRAVL